MSSCLVVISLKKYLGSECVGKKFHHFIWGGEYASSSSLSSNWYLGYVTYVVYFTFALTGQAYQWDLHNWALAGVQASQFASMIACTGNNKFYPKLHRKKFLFSPRLKGNLCRCSLKAQFCVHTESGN